MDIFDEITTDTGDIFDQIGPDPEQQIQQPSGLYERLEDRWNKTKDMQQRQMSGGVVSDVANIPKVAILGAGQAVGAGLDIAGTAIGKAVGAVVPDMAKDYAKEKAVDILQTDAGQKGLMALRAGQEAWDGFSKSYPDAAMSLEALFNFGSLGIAAKATKTAAGAAQAVAKEGMDIADDAARVLTKIAPEHINGRLLGEVRKGIEKGLRPTVIGKGSSGQIAKYYRKAKDAVEAIVENKDKLRFVDEFSNAATGRLPENLDEMVQAISQVKKEIFSKYNALAQGVEGEVVDTTSLVRMLRMIGNKKAVRGGAPDVANFALKRAGEIEELGNLTASQAQDMLQVLNQRLINFHKQPVLTEANNQVIEEVIADALRNKLGKVIQGATGENYAGLRSQYGALSSIEREATHRFLVDARKNPAGLLDFTDIASANQIVSAITGGGPLKILNAATTKGVSSYFKWKNDPNTHIKRMFKNVETLKTRRDSFTPKSTLVKSYQEAKESSRKLKETRDLYNDLDAANKEFFNSIHKPKVGE